MRFEKNEKKVILSADDPHKINGLVRISHIKHIFKVTAQAIYHHIRTGRLTVYKCGYQTYLDPLEYAQMKKWDRSYTVRNGQLVYDDNNFSIAFVAKKLGLKYAQIYYLILMGRLEAKKNGKCIVLGLDALLACQAIKLQVKEMLTEFANAEYIDSCHKRFRPDDEEKVSVI
jgi:hypothetical protein